MNRIGVFSGLLTIAAGMTASGAFAETFDITDDVYIDSAAPAVNFGNNNRQKAVSNAGSTQFPDPSLVHGLLRLPEAFWTAVGTQTVYSAVIHYEPVNNSLHGRGVQLHPMLHAFVVGDGTDGSGATWETWDGINAWPLSGTGGDYDDAFVLATFTPTDFMWDITPLVNNPETRANLQAFGALMKVTDELTFVGNDFISLRSHNNTSGTPYVELTIEAPPACPPFPFDTDEDTDVDMDDFGVFQQCYTGDESAVTPECVCFDINGDNLVNTDDFNAFKACASGPSVPADPGCLD